MKKSIIRCLIVFSWMHSTIYAQSRIPVFELHFSANHPLKNVETDRTFYGGGFGANIIFMDKHTLSFKTGLETNFFHTWNKGAYVGKMASSTNVHYNYWNLFIPLILRLHVGERVKFFVEAGGYLGIPLFGNTASKYYSYPMYQGDVSINETRVEQYEGYFSLSPAVSLGGIFPVSQRVNLILKPEFLFQKNFNVYDGPSYDFNQKFYYVRLCLGIHINLNDEID